MGKSVSPYLLIAAFSIVAMLPSFYSGVPLGPDQTQHYQTAAMVYRSVISGDLYPSYAGDANHGYGDYQLRFYPPLTYYALALARIVVQDWYFASLLALTLAFFIGGVGMYLWAKEEFPPPQALVAALIFTYAPYHLNQIYNSFLLAEFFALAILPFCLMFLTRVCRGAGWKDVFGLATAYALLILTHLPMTIIGSAAMAVYALLLLRKRDAFPTLAKLFAAISLSVVMTAFYWSRMLPELGWISHADPRYASDAFDYRTNFLMLPDHFLRFHDDARSLWFADLMFVVMLLMAAPTVIVLVRKKVKASKYLLAVSAVLVLAFFMTTPLSGPVWDNLGFLQRLQFPWRWLGPVSAFGAVFASVGLMRAAAAMKNARTILLPIGFGTILIVFVFTAAFVTKGAMYTSRADLNLKVEKTSGSEGCDCWRPVWAQDAAFGQTEKVTAAGRQTEVKVWSATDKQFHVAPGAAADAGVAVFYYPHWTATIDGVAVPVERNDPGGIVIALPVQAADVRLTFREPELVTAAAAASILMWLFVMIFSLVLVLRRNVGLPTLPLVEWIDDLGNVVEIAPPARA